MEEIIMDKSLFHFLGFDEEGALEKYQDIDSDEVYIDINKVLNVKIFSVGVITDEIINKLDTQNTEYKKFINLNDIELKALEDNDELLSETDLVVLIGEYEDTKAMTKLEYIIKNARSKAIKTVLLLSVNNEINKDLLREISAKADVVVPIIDKVAMQFEQNAFSFLDKNNLKSELALQYINIIVEFAPKSVSIIEPLDILGTFTHHKGIAYVASGVATGENRAEKAASLALSNIYSVKNYRDCKVILLTFTGGKSLGLLEISEAADFIVDNYGDDETVLFTVVLDESMGNEMRVSIVGI
jgi:hypothetical protein